MAYAPVGSVLGKAPAGKPKPLPPVPIVGQAAPPSDPWSQAQQMVADQLSAARQPLLDEQKYQDAQNAAHAQAIQGFTQALATLLGQISPQVANVYNQAADTQGALARGLSDSAQNAVSGAYKSGADFAGMLGAPAGASAPTPDIGSFTYGLGGYLPATTMNREGAAFASMAALAPRTAAAQGLQALIANTYAGTDADQKIAQQIAELQSKQPGLVQDAYAKLQDLSLRAQQLASDKAYRQAQLTQGEQRLNQQAQAQADSAFYRRAQLGLASKKEAYQEWASQKKLGLAAQQQSFNEWAKQQGLTFQGQRVAIAQQNATTAAYRAQAAAQGKPSAALSRAYGYMVDQYGYPVLGPDGKPIPYQGGKGSPGRQLTAEQAAKFKGTAATIAENSYSGFTTTDKTGNATKHPPLNYQQALVEMGKEGVPLDIAQAALNQYYKPGERSRPWIDFQTRQALLKAGAPPALVKKAITSYQAAQQLERQYKLPGAQPDTATGPATTPQGARSLAFQTAQAKYGWGDADLQALDSLIMGESGWNYQARNPSSGALGIGQALGHKLPPDYATNPVTQINWMLNYIAQRYGNPQNAYRFWLSNNPHWY